MPHSSLLDSASSSHLAVAGIPANTVPGPACVSMPPPPSLRQQQIARQHANHALLANAGITVHTYNRGRGTTAVAVAMNMNTAGSGRAVNAEESAHHVAKTQGNGKSMLPAGSLPQDTWF